MTNRGIAWRSLLALLAISSFPHEAAAFASLQRPALSRWSRQAQSKTAIHMAVTPVGPFCPFCSSSAQEMEPIMESLNSATPEFASELTRIQLDIQLATKPDPDRLRKVAMGIDAAVTEWERLVTRLRLSNDFQSREYAKLIQAHLETHGLSADDIVKMVRWQSGLMMALADDTPPPMPPPDLDLMKVMQQSESEKPPSISSMTAAEKITCSPFTGEEDAFESPTVANEYQTLCRDHAALIEMGSSYANFDPAGKLAYLDEIEKIEDRWDVFFARFQLLGIMNKEYIRECNAFLASMDMDEEQFRKLLKKTHQIMREDAENERNSMVQ